MKKSDLFKKIYTIISDVQNSIGESYDNSVILPELTDEEMDLSMPENSKEFVKVVLYWYSNRTSYILASALTELLAEIVKIDDDANLYDLDTVERLTADVDDQ